jgi:hypothetical protein
VGGEYPRIAAAFGAGMLTACTVAGGKAPLHPSSGREEIYVLRSVRERHAPVANWCDRTKTGFDPFPTDAERRGASKSPNNRRRNGHEGKLYP